MTDATAVLNETTIETVHDNRPIHHLHTQDTDQMTTKMTTTQLLRAIHNIVDADESGEETYDAFENIAELLHVNGYKVGWLERAFALMAHHRRLQEEETQTP
jgi:hypothetical protein